ncbi:MAG TPA: ATP-binding cassette domain-containing protein [Leucothrix mucor]|nr:ATP-binding cassette domain-containing protein [Leucothrix mucor]
MIILSELSLRRGGRELLTDTTFKIHPGQKVGVTGANGTGKSTLFALIRDELHQDSGEFSLPVGWVIAHVAQETPATDISALDYALQGDLEYVSLHKELEMAEGARLGEIHAQLEAIDGYTTESRAATLLHGLGFKPEDINNPVTSFSGGWRMRLNLIQALMCRSDLLLLDEPTNHLDLDAVIWLQDWLIRYTGTLLLISHDREFLDAVIKQVAHIEHGKLTLYTGNYTAFEHIRAEKLAQQQSAFEKQQRERAHMQKYVDRFRAQATKAKQAQSRLKALERMEEISPAHIDSPFHFQFFKPKKLPDRLITVEEVSVGYGDVNIIENVDFHLTPGKRIGLIGPNGAGKSTFIKLLAGELNCSQGEISFAQDFKLGYFAQHQLEQLDFEQTPLEHLRVLDREAREQDLRNYLGGFNFKGERIDEAVAPFSGGEKARLVLALLIYQRPNVLLLDEPTNHLDLEMRHALSIALQDFQGAMVIVSHDRHMLKTVTDELMIVDNKKVMEFAGDLDDYAQWLKDKDKAEQAEIIGSETENKPVSRKEQRKLEAELRKKLQPLKRNVDKLEKQLDSLSTQQADLEKILADPNIYTEENKQKLKQTLLKKRETDSSLEDIEMQWMEASEDYEQQFTNLSLS